jgi:hypothetical protein
METTAHPASDVVEHDAPTRPSWCGDSAGKLDPKTPKTEASLTCPALSHLPTGQLQKEPASFLNVEAFFFLAHTSRPQHHQPRYPVGCIDALLDSCLPNGVSMGGGCGMPRVVMFRQTTVAV